MGLHENQLHLLKHLVKFNVLDYSSCLKMLATPELTDPIALSYAFRPLTKNGYLSKRKDGSVSITAKGRALFPGIAPVISAGGGANEIRRVIEVSRTAAPMEYNGLLHRLQRCRADARAGSSTDIDRISTFPCRNRALKFRVVLAGFAGIYHFKQRQGEYKLAEEEYNLTAQKCTHFNRDVREILHTTLLLQTQGWETAEANFSRIRQDHKENPYVRNLRYKIVCAKLIDKKVPLYEHKKLEEEKTQLATSKMLDPFQQFQCYDPQLS